MKNVGYSLCSNNMIIRMGYPAINSSLLVLNS